jgi:lysine 2,3-aminomutase
MQTLEKTKTSWNEQFRDSIKTTQELSNFLETNIPDTKYPIFIPREFAQKIKESGPNSPLWNQFIPSTKEELSQGHTDPIGDDLHSKGSGIIHRYKNRLLFNPTTICPINCRYCFRKNELFNNLDIFKSNLESLAEYLINHPEVEEVILTGGDPLILSTPKIEKIFKILKLIPTVKYIRFHTRTPVILPARLDLELASLLNEYAHIFQTITLAIHINHSDEITDDLEKNLKQFKGINLLSQTVLLKNVNDDPNCLATLFKDLNKLNIRPYYLHHPDLVRGAMHFHMPLEVGRRIYSSLRDLIPGWLIPGYVVDSPTGIGKVNAYNPESIQFSGRLLDRFNQVHESKLI